jgi:hypothetical protein
MQAHGSIVYRATDVALWTQLRHEGAFGTAVDDVAHLVEQNKNRRKYGRKNRQ